MVIEFKSCDHCVTKKKIPTDQLTTQKALQLTFNLLND